MAIQVGIEVSYHHKWVASGHRINCGIDTIPRMFLIRGAYAVPSRWQVHIDNVQHVASWFAYTGPNSELAAVPLGNREAHRYENSQSPTLTARGAGGMQSLVARHRYAR